MYLKRILLILFISSFSIPAFGIPTISITPQHARYDEVVSIVIDGLRPDQRVDIRLSGSSWSSRGVFIGNSFGQIDLARDASIGGSYTGVDPMGLFWSLGWASASDIPPDYAALNHLEIKIANEEDPVIASTFIDRLACLQDPTVIREPTDPTTGFVGTLFRSRDGKQRPGLVVLGGSEGGLQENWACMLATRGFTTLALAYFKMPGLPRELKRIPLEYFGEALDWFARNKNVKGPGVGVVGGSKGGELALLLGATYSEQVGAVVAYVPSGIVWDGISSTPPSGSSWTLRGEDLPFLKFNPSMVDFSHPPFKLRQGYESALGDGVGVRHAAIPVEKIKGPILLVSGGDDALWPSSRLSNLVIERLTANHHPYPYTHLAYEGAGHGIRIPYLPTTATSTKELEFGGSPEANAHAAKDSWSRTLRLLSDALR